MIVGVALVLRSRGVLWRRTLVVGVVAMALAGVSTWAWQRFIVGTAKVEAGEKSRHADAAASFDEAFDKAEAPPPERQPKGGDAGAHFGDDAESGAPNDGTPGRSE